LLRLNEYHYRVFVSQQIKVAVWSVSILRYVLKFFNLNKKLFLHSFCQIFLLLLYVYFPLFAF
jgi:hypothetical protein